MKTVFYLSAAALFLITPGISQAQTSESLSPTEVFCSNISAKSGNVIRAISKMARSSKLSYEEKQVLIDMSRRLNKEETIENMCFPSRI